ncbi:hypothetical protein DAPPUDRAFT_104637 [Daphnia pulex]|uniref:Uncharacterized protein n=1 Tax=Daphnia pulex TaxID=6669 RepID=E9GMV5_DAPPU|nr:hypothetical protein DAPPUDRAFT_104637 [Daphnia pulex]|eukprot:EFX79158.1 hypothetical protein DAPPUDRAFT_104637 [Daphnia pulex]
MTSRFSKTIMPCIQITSIPSLEGIDLADRILEWQLKNGNLLPSLSDEIKIEEAHGVSGLSDVDYPMLKGYCMMGLFTLIQRAWLSRFSSLTSKICYALPPPWKWSCWMCFSGFNANYEEI